MKAVLFALVASLRACFRSRASLQLEVFALRSDEHRAMRWKALLAWVRDTLVAASPESLAGLRARKVVATVR